MENENYEKVVEWCKEYIEEFETCGLKEDVLKRIFELVQWLEKRKLEKQKVEDREVDWIKIIPIGFEYYHNLAEFLSKHHKTKCEYYRKWLDIPFTKKGGLLHWVVAMSQ
jgi:hypothetical protein